MSHIFLLGMASALVAVLLLATVAASVWLAMRVNAISKWKVLYEASVSVSLERLQQNVNENINHLNNEMSKDRTALTSYVDSKFDKLRDQFKDQLKTPQTH